jgi:hypothetical protein
MLSLAIELNYFQWFIAFRLELKYFAPIVGWEGESQVPAKLGRQILSLTLIVNWQRKRNSRKIWTRKRNREIKDSVSGYLPELNRPLSSIVDNWSQIDQREDLLSWGRLHLLNHDEQPGHLRISFSIKMGSRLPYVRSFVNRSSE